MKVQGVICIFLAGPALVLFWMQNMWYLLRDPLLATKYARFTKSVCQYEDISEVCGSTKIWWRASNLWTFKMEDRISNSETVCTSPLPGIRWYAEHFGSWGVWFYSSPHLFVHHLTFGKSGRISEGGFPVPANFRRFCISRLNH